MQPSGEIGRFEVEDQPSPPADANRSLPMHRVNPCLRLDLTASDLRRAIWYTYAYGKEST